MCLPSSLPPSCYLKYKQNDWNTLWGPKGNSEDGNQLLREAEQKDGCRGLGDTMGERNKLYLCPTSKMMELCMWH